ncbi:hypothetical protein BH24BAC1_BH24BAC1_40850 [soil metagenome]
MGKFLLLFLFLPLSLLGQNFPVDTHSGKITYSEDILVKDASESELYDRAKAWIRHSSPPDQVRLKEDTPNGLLTGTTFTQVAAFNGKAKNTYALWYTVMIRVEDDRYWYRLSGFLLQPQPSLQLAASPERMARKQPLEELVFPKKAEGRSANPTALPAKAEKAIMALLEDLKAYLLTGGER